MRNTSLHDWVPKTLRGLSSVERNDLVVSVVRDSHGLEQALSRLGDMTWDLSPFPWPRNVQPNAKRLRFPELEHQKLVIAIQNALYVRLRIGVDGYPSISANHLSGIFFRLVRFIRWLDKRGIASLAEVTFPLCLEYAAHCRSRLGRNGPASPNSVKLNLTVVEMLWQVRELIDDGLLVHPWPGETAISLAGLFQRGVYQGKTKAIPEEIAHPLFIEAERLLNQSESLLNARDALDSLRREAEVESISKKVFCKRARALLKQRGLPRLRVFNSLLTRLRDAIYILIGVTTGMRDHELASLRKGAFYTSEHDGETYGWLKGNSSKTYAGDVEWMVPIEIGEKCIAVLERLTAPLQSELDSQISAIEGKLKQLTLDSSERRDLVVELHVKREHSGYLLLTKDPKRGSIQTMTNDSVQPRLKDFVRYLGLKWHIHPHQFRATFAAYVAGSVYGDLRYLKKHYKHWTMDMTLLYAHNHKQDVDLYEDIYDSMHDFNVRVIDHLLDPQTPISGGASERIKIFRRDQAKTFKSRKEMVEGLSELVVIRASGHGWCMADVNGCGGLGLIEKVRCVYCSNGVIDDTHVQVWTNIYHQQCELLDLDDIGPGGRQRVQRDLRAAEKVLNDLGVPFEPAQVSETQL